jgi:hypothetical protein
MSALNIISNVQKDANKRVDSFGPKDNFKYSSTTEKLENEEVADIMQDLKISGANGFEQARIAGLNDRQLEHLNKAMSIAQSYENSGITVTPEQQEREDIVDKVETGNLVNKLAYANFGESDNNELDSIINSFKQSQGRVGSDDIKNNYAQSAQINQGHYGGIV